MGCAIDQTGNDVCQPSATMERDMSDLPTSADANVPNLEAEELAAKHNISVEDAKAIIDEQGHDRGAKDFAAQELKEA